MNTKIASELKVRITVMLIFWAVICLTALPNRSTIMKSKLQSDISIENVIDYLTQL